MAVSIFGLGYVGAVSAACFASKGTKVIGVEVNKEKLELFKKGEIPIFEPGLSELLKDGFNTGQFSATDSSYDAVMQSDISFICVGTPSLKGGGADTTFIKRASAEIGSAIKNKDDAHSVVVRSTMLPGSIREIVVPAIEESSGKKEGEGFFVLANPEFMREGSAIDDFFNPPFIVIGENAPKSGNALETLYSCVEAPVQRTTIEAAESIKFACNAFHAMKVTFANEIGQFCKIHNIDARRVMEIVCSDHSLNISETYLKPGMPFGGSCLPKDLKALNKNAQNYDVELPMLNAIMQSNQRQINNITDYILGAGVRNIGILGLSFKAGTDDLRESPIVLFCETLLGKGCNISIHDSEIELTKLIGANKSYLEEKIPHINTHLNASLKNVVENSDLLLLCKKHSDYDNINSMIDDDTYLVDLVGYLDKDQISKGKYMGLYW